MIEKRKYEGKLYLEGYKVDFWEGFQVTTSKNSGCRASCQLFDIGIIRTRIIPGTKVQFFVKNDGFSWVDEADVKLGEFFLCFDGIITGSSFGLFRTQMVTLDCEGHSFYSRIFKTSFLADFSMSSDKNPLQSKDGLMRGISSLSNKMAELQNAFTEANNLIINGDVSKELETSNDLNRLSRSNMDKFMQDLFNQKDFRLNEYLSQLVKFKEEEKKHRDATIKAKKDGTDLPTEFTSKQPDKKIKLKLSEIFNYFLWRYTENISDSKELFYNHKINLESSKVETKVTTIAGENDLSLNDNYSKALLENDLFIIGLHQSIINLASSPMVNGFDAMLTIASYFNFKFFENVFPSKKEDGSINSYLFKPDVFFATPPTCNILFKGDVVSASGSRRSGYEPSRNILTYKPWVTATDLAELYTRTTKKQSKELEVKIAIASGRALQKDNRAIEGIDSTVGLTNYKTFNLIPENPLFQNLDDFFSIYNRHTGSQAALIGTTNPEEREKNFEYILEKAKIKFWEKYYSNRSFSANLAFSPFLVVGHPCVIMDSVYSTVGDLDSITHTFKHTGLFSTNIFLNRPRWVDYWGPSDLDVPADDFKFHTSDFASHNISDIYKQVYSCDAFITTAGKENSVELCRLIDDKIKDDLKDTIGLTTDEYKKEFKQTLDPKRKRSFVSEDSFFSDLINGDISSFIKEGVFAAHEITELGKGVAFSSDRQAVIKLWNDEIKKKSKFLKESSND